MGAKSPAEMEADALKTIENDEKLAAVPQHPDNFNIVDGMPLPEGFENPPCGSFDHFCVGPDGLYRKDWFQIRPFCTASSSRIKSSPVRSSARSTSRTRR